MKPAYTSLRILSTVLLASATVLAGSLSSAQDILPSAQQDDDQLSVWADNVSLRTFVSQLAGIAGREAVIEGELTGQVSGRFDGSLADTLSTVGEQFDVLFDLDEGTLGVVSEAARSSAIIALGGASIDEQTRESLMSELLPGNDVKVREGEVAVVGHPGFVQRIVRQVSTIVGGAGQEISVEITPLDLAADLGLENGQLLQAAPSTSTPTGENASQSSVEVVDAAAQEMLDEVKDESGDVGSENETASKPAPIRWVTDIPGYETF